MRNQTMFRVTIVLLVTILFIPTALAQSTQSGGEMGTASQLGITQFNEAPMLTDLVQRGDLPHVGERLPKDPVVVRPYGEVGQYGGTWYRFDRTTTLSSTAYILYETYRRFYVNDRDEFYRTNDSLAIDFVNNDDSSQWTMSLHPGVKWSDGAPFTSDDIVFWWELLLDSDYPSSPGAWTRVEGVRMNVVKVDDFTVRFEFVGPNPLFPYQFAFLGSKSYAPRHYLQTFHPDFNSLEALGVRSRADAMM